MVGMAYANFCPLTICTLCISSGREIITARLVSLSSEINWLTMGGDIRRSAWGSVICHRVWR
ncbi:hypothetical protein D3C75_1065990 [compost metagenome]